MFATCADPGSLDTFHWFACYLTTGKHLLFYASLGTVLLLLFVTAPVALALGFMGAMASRARFLPLRIVGRAYIAMVRGVPDIVFFLFFVIALDQGLEYVRHKIKCPGWTAPIRQGADFLVCPQAKLPLSSAPEYVHQIYGFALAVFTFGIVFGAFTANVLFGAMRAVPQAQVETAEAYGMSHRQAFWRVLVPQMWLYALPGLSNLWMILVKATPLLFLLGVEDIVYWAKELGGTKTGAFSYPHHDWRVWYFLALLIVYLMMTWASQKLLGRLTARLTRGQATIGGDAMQKQVTA